MDLGKDEIEQIIEIFNDQLDKHKLQKSELSKLTRLAYVGLIVLGFGISIGVAISSYKSTQNYISTSEATFKEINDQVRLLQINVAKIDQQNNDQQKLNDIFSNKK